MIRQSNQTVAEYHALLTGNESLSTLRRALRLVWQLVGANVRLNAGRLSARWPGHDTEEKRQLENLAQRIWSLGVEEERNHIVAAQRKLRALVRETTFALQFVPAFLQMKDVASFQVNSSLLLDSCIVLAHHAYFVLLPRLDAASPGDREALLAACREFADSVTVAADRFALMALYFDAVNQPQKSNEAHRAALAATPADAHEFMTALQSAWSDMIEREMPGDALELLLDNYSRVPRRDIDEVNELIRETFRYTSAASNGHSLSRNPRYEGRNR